MGYRAAGVEMDPATERALGALDEVLEDADLGRLLDFEPGQIQIVNNRWCGHGRTGYFDASEESKRLLLRLWHREHGRRSYSG